MPERTARRVRPSRVAQNLLREPAPDYTCLALSIHDNEAKYITTLRTAFDFFRRNAEGKYSDNTLMNLTRAYDSIQYGGDRSHLPFIALAEAPYEYDEETEVKRGGTLGMMVVWPDKAILAVNRGGRRKGIGGTLFNRVRYTVGDFSMWIGKTNQTGHMFCLSQGMFPSAMNGQGAVRYMTGEESTDE